MRLKPITWANSFLHPQGLHGSVGRFHFDIFPNAWYPEIQPEPYRLKSYFHGEKYIAEGKIEDLKEKAQEWVKSIVMGVIE